MGKNKTGGVSNLNRVPWAIILILAGTLLLLRSFHLLPSFNSEMIFQIARQYWPVLLVLFGLHILVKDKTSAISEVIKWILIAFLAFYVFCGIFGRF
jgi:hypothetical protein